MFKKCIFCEKEFEAHYFNVKYCSEECRKEAQRKINEERAYTQSPTLKLCKYCGSEFVSQRSAEYCSRICCEIDKGRRVVFICDNCGTSSSKNKAQLNNKNFCCKKCADEYQVKNEERKCEYCGKKYIAKHKEQKYCGYECHQKSRTIIIPKEKLIKLYIDKEFTTRDIADIFDTSKTVVLKRLKEFGIPIRPDGFNNRERIECLDGHMVRSSYEKIFDNLLYNEGIEHEYEPRLPWNKRYTTDFKVGDIYIEIWGMMNVKKYRDRHDRKIKMYKENNIKLINIYPEDFIEINNKLDELKSLLK